MSIAAFGPGILIATRTDIANAPAVNVGYCNEFSLDTAATNKELFGQNKFPLVVAQGTVKVSGKFKPATISGIAWNNTMFGQSFTSGGFTWNIDEAHSVPAPAGPYTVLVTDSATFDVDLGVRYAANLLPLQRVAAGSEAAGKYSVVQSGGGKGTYTFAVADASVNLLFTYTKTVAGGQSLIVTNTLIGTTPTFQLDYYTALNQPTSKPFAVRLFSCVGSKLSLAAKLEDFIMPEQEFSVFANAAGQVYTFVFPDVS